MWQEKLKEIIYILENSNVNEIEVSFWGKKFRVVKSGHSIISDTPESVKIQNPHEKNQSTNEEKSLEQDIAKTSSEGEDLLSPMPGTFYTSPTPDDPPFTKVGSKVTKGQTLCIIEAMKIMNEIESEINGIVTEVYIDDGNPVEYNQPLFKIKPA